MAYYITYGEFQQHMKDYFFRTGSRMQFPEWQITFTEKDFSLKRLRILY